MHANAALQDPEHGRQTASDGQCTKTTATGSSPLERVSSGPLALHHHDAAIRRNMDQSSHLCIQWHGAHPPKGEILGGHEAESHIVVGGRK